MHIRGLHRAGSPKFRCRTHGSKFFVRSPPRWSFLGALKLSFKPHSLELSWCVYWVIASLSQAVIKDLRLILAQSPRHANLDTNRSFENSSISSPVGQRAAFRAEMALLIPPACCLLVLRSIPFGFGLGLAPSPCTFIQSSPLSSETRVPRCDGPSGHGRRAVKFTSEKLFLILQGFCRYLSCYLWG